MLLQGLYDRFKKDKPLRFRDAVDLDIFKTKVDPRKRDPFTVLVPLRDHPSKGTKYAIEAMGMLRKKSDRYRFIGYGNLSRELIPDYVEYYYKPTNRELSDIYNKASIFIYTSLVEGFASPPLEAMASGCAAVIADSIGMREYAKSNFNSIIVPIKNPVSMAKAVSRLTKDIAFKNRLAMNGIGTAKKFGYEGMYKSFGSLFE